MRVVKCPQFFSRRLAHFLSGDIRQVNVFIVRFMISPHHKDNLEPLCAQSPQCLMMAVSFGPLISIVVIRPLTAIERDKCQPVSSVAHDLVTRETKLHQTALAAGFGNRHHSRLSLKVTKRLPAALGIAQLSPKRGYDRARLGSRQHLYQLSRRHRGEKTFDPLIVTLNAIPQSLQLNHQHRQKSRLGSDHMLGYLKLGLIQLLPQLFGSLFSKMVLALGKGDSTALE
jgi:hypothetical protein